MGVLRNFINGQFIQTDRYFADINPADGSLVAEVCEADQSLVDHAVRSARSALAGPWGRCSIQERAAALHKIADGIEASFDCLVAAEVADTGKPVSLARKLDIPRAAANFRAFADLIKTAPLESFQTDTPDGRTALNIAVRNPVGVVGIITPWNLPLLLLTWKVAPALACGNTVVVKPSEETPASATLLAEIIARAGLPDGVFNVVHGGGADSAGEFLSSHPDLDAIAFTGESRTGSAIMRAASAGVKPVSFELGGKNAAVVFADCPWDETIRGLRDAIFLNTGQVCLCAERVYVERPIFARVIEALQREAQSLELGWPNNPDTTMGPLISHAHREKVTSYFELACTEGAHFITGGEVPRFNDARDSGCYIEPTLLTGLSEQARCVKEEIFGPVAHLAPFDSEEEAVALANDTDYGLASSIWTSNLQRAHRVSRQMRTGITWVNCWFLRDLRTPFGGVGLSGIGREGGVHSLNFYSELNNICIKI